MWFSVYILKIAYLHFSSNKRYGKFIHPFNNCSLFLEIGLLYTIDKTAKIVEGVYSVIEKKKPLKKLGGKLEIKILGDRGKKNQGCCSLRVGIWESFSEEVILK